MILHDAVGINAAVLSWLSRGGDPAAVRTLLDTLGDGEVASSHPDVPECAATGQHTDALASAVGALSDLSDSGPMFVPVPTLPGDDAAIPRYDYTGPVRNSAVLCSLARGADHGALLEIAAPTFAYYAAVHALDCVLLRDVDLATGRPAAWDKIVVLRALLEHYETVLWVDCDAIFVDFGRDIRQQLEPGPSLHLVVHRYEGKHQPNTGVMVLRRGSASVELLEEVWQRVEYVAHPWWEQAALMELIGSEPRGRSCTPFGPTCFSPCVGTLEHDWNSIEQDSAAHPVVKHYPGKSHAERVRAMRQDLRVAYARMLPERLRSPDSSSVPQVSVPLHPARSFGFHNLPTREQLPALLNLRGLTGVGVEVGVQRGLFSEHLLRRWQGMRLISVDPWRAFAEGEYQDIANVDQAEQDRRCVETRVRLGRFGERSVIWRTTSLEAAAAIDDHSLDFVYLDARHDYVSVLEDLEAWYPKLRVGGVIAGHDYVDGHFPEGDFGVRSAVDEFFAERGLRVHATLRDAPWTTWVVCTDPRSVDNRSAAVYLPSPAFLDPVAVHRPRWLTTPRSPTLGVIMIVRNEAQNLPALFQSIAEIADELVVVDTGSTDGTVALCERWGARVVQQAWTNDFSHARNRAIAEATADFLLWLDADDRVPEHTQQILRSVRDELLPQRPNHAYAMEVQNLNAAGAVIDTFVQTRIFPRRDGVRFRNAIHEEIATSLAQADVAIVRTDWALVHTGYSTQEVVRGKARRNEAMLREALAEDPTNVHHLVHMAQTVAALGQLTAAEANLSEAIQQAKASTPPDFLAELHTLRATYREAMGKRLGAIYDLEQAIRLHPGWLVPYGHLADLRAQHDEWDEVAAIVEASRSAEPLSGIIGFSLPRVHKVLALVEARVAVRQGQTRAAQPAYARALSLDPQDVRTRLEWGQALLNAEDYLAARSVLEPLGRDEAALEHFVEVSAAIGLARAMTGDEPGANACLAPLVELFAAQLEHAEEVSAMTLAEVLLVQGYAGAARNMVTLFQRTVQQAA